MTGPPGATPLVIEGLVVSLGDQPVVDGVDLTVGRGDLVGLIGPNGAGKTTLLRAVLDLVPTDAGRILVDGEPPGRRRPLIGYVPQRHEFAWDFPISVERAVLTGRTRAVGWLRRPGASDHEAVAEALERVGMSHLRHRPIGELSGGQRQRVLVARALALRPGLLLLDEPFTGVDVPTQELLTTLVVDLLTEGRALLMATHDLRSAARTATRLCLLNRSVVAEGSPADMRDPRPWLDAFGVPSTDLFADVAGPR